MKNYPVMWEVIGKYIKLAGGNSNIVYVHPYLGKIPMLANMFQMGWFNHQLDLHRNGNSHFWGG